MFKNLVFWTIVVLSLAISLVSYRFVAIGLDAAFESMQDHITERPIALLLHVSFAPIALALSPFQMIIGLRARRPALHRWMGRITASAIVISALAGLVLAAGAFVDRPVAGLGFGLLSIFWITATLFAVYFAMIRDIDRHRRWMVRSFTLTLAALTLRLQLPLIMGFGEIDYAAASQVVAWLCWVPNLIIAEYLLSDRTRRRIAIS
jgi:uncharacterized membrane protein